MTGDLIAAVCGETIESPVDMASVYGQPHAGLFGIFNEGPR